MAAQSPTPIPATSDPTPVVSTTPQQQRHRTIAFATFVVGVVLTGLQSSLPTLAARHPEWTWIAPAISAVSGLLIIWQKYKDIFGISATNYSEPPGGGGV